MIDPPAMHMIKLPLTDEENRERVTSNSLASSTKADVNKGPTAPTAPQPKAKVIVKASFFHRGQLRGSLGDSEGYC